MSLYACGYGVAFEGKPVTIDTTRNVQTGEFDGINRFLNLLKEHAPELYKSFCNSTAGDLFQIYMQDNLESRKDDLKEIATLLWPGMKHDDMDITIDDGDIVDYLAVFFSDNYTGTTPEIVFVLAPVIEEAENIHLTCITGSNGIPYMVLKPSYPWSQATEEERALKTEEDLIKLINKYVELLTGNDLTYYGASAGYYQIVECCE